MKRDPKDPKNARYFGRNHVPPVPSTIKGQATTWGPRLDAWRVKYNLSVVKLVPIVGNTLQSTQLFKLLNGSFRPRMEAAMKAYIEANIRQWLRDVKKLPKLQVEKEVVEIFAESKTIGQEVESVITDRTTLSRDAQKHFGLSRDPFTGDPRSTREIFRTPYTDKVLAQLEDAINYQHFVCVIGEVGSGKRNLTRQLMESCKNSHGKMVLLWPEFPDMRAVNSGSICTYLLKEFEESCPRDRVQRAVHAKKMLAALSEQGIRVALGFDDCHQLDPSLLTALKHFYEWGSGGFDRYLGLILLGQPRFRTVLGYPQHREIAERLTMIDLGYDKPKKARSGAISNGNGQCLGQLAWEYVAHRLKLAGSTAEKLFDRQAVAALAQIGNTPQAIGNLCNAALATAAEMNERRVHTGVLKAAGLLNDDTKMRIARA